MKQYSSKKSIQILAHILKEFNINNIVISPGSRNAPLAIHFSEDQFNCYSIVDERSAAFVALGMAKNLREPVVVCCTSGSAATNYYPAVVEAFYQNIPLLVLTADRPAEYIDIFDGQTIRQNNLFHQHSYGEFQLKEDTENNANQYNWDTIKEAVANCWDKSGPVHINIPLSEPLYNFVSDIEALPKIDIKKNKPECFINDDLVQQWNRSAKKLILLGTLPPSPQLQEYLKKIAKNNSAVVLSEANSNHFDSKFFNHIDRYISNFDEADYKTFSPDLLITIGQNVVSKRVKQFLRSSKFKNHWHVDPFWQPDTYFGLTEKIKTNPEDFFSQLLEKINLDDSDYLEIWNQKKNDIDIKHEEYIAKVEFSDFYIFNNLLEHIPTNYKVHISNSTPIRYVQLFNYSQNHEIYCNRGTSGIDGCTSTAMGFAIKEKDPTLLISGDIGFFYDINGLWNHYIPSNTRIILINNGGGNIFRIIPGPGEAHALDKYIATAHHLNAKDIAKHFKFDYYTADNPGDYLHIMEDFFNAGEAPKILEINTSKKDNASILKEYFCFLKS